METDVVFADKGLNNSLKPYSESASDDDNDRMFWGIFMYYHYLMFRRKKMLNYA